MVGLTPLRYNALSRGDTLQLWVGNDTPTNMSPEKSGVLGIGWRAVQTAPGREGQVPSMKQVSAGGPLPGLWKEGGALHLSLLVRTRCRICAFALLIFPILIMCT